jgi:glycine/D-amino acid oxidase-like deaminating enzyme
VDDARHDVVIAGGGLAGAATAFWLARAARLSILLVERENALAVHSSGRNAGMVRRSAGAPALDRFCDEGAAFLAAPPRDFGGATGWRRTGSFLVATPQQARAWERPGVARVDADALARAWPAWRVDAGVALLHTADDGVADSRAVVAGFVAGARSHGVVVQQGARVESLEVRDGRIAAARVGGRRIACRVVVDATGAWAGEVARAAGGDDPGVRASRRHLLVTTPDPRIDPAWPWVWDHVRGFYARPEAGGLLACACDERIEPAGDCPADPAHAAAIVAKLAVALPDFASLRVARFWAGQRTRRDDERFVLGPARALGGLHFAAGLGGHGLTAAAAMGRVAAEGILAELGRSVVARDAVA